MPRSEKTLRKVTCHGEDLGVFYTNTDARTQIVIYVQLSWEFLAKTPTERTPYVSAQTDNQRRDESMSIKALVADDSGVMRKIIIRALNGAGITDVVEAVDGEDAVKQFGAESIDIVLTDWNMPGKTGLEVAQAIRATGSTVPIIMVTTEAEKSRVLEAIQAGVNDYLCKPFEVDALQQKLEKFALV